MATMVVLLALLVCAPAPAAPALGEGASPAANSRYKVGRRLYKKGDFAGAAREFEVAFEMIPGSAKLAYNLARSEERAGNLAAAVAAYQAYLRLAPDAADKVEVEAVISALERRVRAALPQVVVTSNPPGASVVVDEAEAPSGETPLTLQLEPGAHRLRLTLEGHTSGDEMVQVREGEPNEVHAELTPISEPVPWQTWAGWAGVGLGAAGLAVGVVYTLKAAETSEQGATVKDRVNLGENLDTQHGVSWTGYIGGALFLGGGLALLLWPEDDATAWLQVVPGGVAATMRW